MSVTWHWHVSEFVSVNFQKMCECPTHIITESAYVGHTRGWTRENVIFSAFLIFLSQDKHITRTKQRNTCLDVLIFSWSLKLFRHVTNMSMTYQKMPVLLVFDPSQHKTTFPTKCSYSIYSTGVEMLCLFGKAVNINIAIVVMSHKNIWSHN